MKRKGRCSRGSARRSNVIFIVVKVVFYIQCSYYDAKDLIFFYHMYIVELVYILRLLLFTKVL